jgi:GAF domain-containing protein
MFEFLTRKHNIADNSFGLPKPELEPVPEDKKEDKTVEYFIKTGGFQGNNLVQFTQNLFSLIARQKEISQGVFFLCDKIKSKPVLRFISGYAYQKSEESEEILKFGEGFPGQVAKDGKLMNITDIPEGYMTIESGLGKASPASLIIFPIKHNGKMLAVIELASFHKFTEEDERFFEEISPAIAKQLVKCIANT